MSLTVVRIPPVALLGAPWPAALFLFPRQDAGGKPLITETSASLELHSTINGSRQPNGQGG